MNSRWNLFSSFLCRKFSLPFDWIRQGRPVLKPHWVYEFNLSTLFSFLIGCLPYQINETKDIASKWEAVWNITFELMLTFMQLLHAWECDSSCFVYEHAYAPVRREEGYAIEIVGRIQTQYGLLFSYWLFSLTNQRN